MHVVLVYPQIAANTGNIIRLCANTGAVLHLVRPLGFDLDDSKMRRAGLDYHEYADMRVHDNITQAFATLPGRIFGLSAEGQRSYEEPAYHEDDSFVFGCENPGLPTYLRQEFGERLLRIPMMPNNRSLNLSNAVAVMVYEAWRQLGFTNAVPRQPANN